MARLRPEDAGESGVSMKTAVPLPLDRRDLDAFITHPWLAAPVQSYDRDAILARHAAARLIQDLESINTEYIKEHGRVAFTTIQGRVKEPTRFMKKLQDKCRKQGEVAGITQATPQEMYSEVKDLCGVRFSCPYFDEIETAIAKLVRPRLSDLGYATDLSSDHRYQDKNYLEDGDDVGYRSYHFFVRIPTPVDVYGGVEMCLCEVQARSELQHIWAAKSHDLLYDPREGWNFASDEVVDDMKHISNSLRSVDHLLMRIRQAARGGVGDEIRT